MAPYWRKELVGITPESGTLWRSFLSDWILCPWYGLACRSDSPTRHRHIGLQEVGERTLPDLKLADQVLHAIEPERFCWSILLKKRSNKTRASSASTLRLLSILP